MTYYTRTAIETFEGRQFDYEAPDPSQIALSDIGRALNNTCRFGGFVPRFHSVLSHSVNVGEFVHAVDPELAWFGLMHDAHEAFVGDLPTPLKRAMEGVYQPIVARADRAILDAFDLERYGEGIFHHPIIKHADAVYLDAEAKAMKTWADDRPSPVMAGDPPVLVQDRRPTEFYARAIAWRSLVK